jgi:small-conductance mechanosensitive channel
VVLSLTLTSVLLIYYGYGNDFVDLIIQLTSIWFLINAVRVFSESRTLAILVGFILVSNVVLKIFGLLEPTAALLDSAAIDLGSIRLSILSVMKYVAYFTIIIWFANLFVSFMHYYVKTLKMELNTKSLVQKTGDVVIYFLAFMMFLKLADIDITAFAVFGGAIGVGIGMGLQKIASNFIGGFILLFEGSIKLDDVVELADGTFGFVRKLGARGTMVEAFNGKEVIIPNDDLITKNVINWSHTDPTARLEVFIGVGYESDLDKVVQLILEATRESKACMLNPEPKCFLDQFADNRIIFRLLFWVQDIKQGIFKPKNDVMIHIWRKFKEHGIEMPVPQRELYIKSMPEEVAE